MYKILNILQPSVVYNDKYVDRDSNVQMYSTVHKTLSKNKDFELYLTIPKKHNYDLNSLFPNTNFIEIDYDLNPYNYRLNLDINQILKQKYSIILNNIPEITFKLKKLYYDIPIVFFCYFLDTPTYPKTNYNVLWPYQLSGMLLSNILTFTSKSTFIDVVKNIVNTKIYDIFLKKPKYILDFGFSKNELNQIKEIEHLKFIKNYKILFFPNRITKPDYTNFEIFKNTILELKDILIKNNYKIIIANPSEKYYKKEDFKKIFSDLYIPIGPFERNEYLYVLQNSTIVFSLFVNELYGGCSNTEAIYLKKLTLMPYINEYKERAFRRKMKFFTKKDFSDIKNVLKFLIENPNYAENFRNLMSKHIEKQSSIENQSLILEKIIYKYGVKL